VKITDIVPILINTDGRVSWGTGFSKNWVLVKVVTDEGINGIGEAFGTGKAKTTETAFHEFARWLIGQDPTRIVHNWQAIFRGSRYPLGTETMGALSAIEQALWDITGKKFGIPIYQMLGGAVRDKIQVYASPNTFGGKPLFEAAELIEARGFSGIKFTPQPDDYASKSSDQIIQDSVERVRRMREVMGPRMEICLDYHGRSFSPAEAIRLANAVEPYNIFFFEEPALSENPDSLAEAKSKTSIPIAAGERAIGRERMRELIEKRAVHILQPEPAAYGGILETFKIAATAELYHINIAPHHACSLVSLAMCAHLAACLPNFLIQEVNVNLDDPVLHKVFRTFPTIRNGFMELPQGPGLGVELDEEAASEYPYKPFDRPVIINRDGSIGLE
jgi:galactonate dehydratase